MVKEMPIGGREALPLTLLQYLLFLRQCAGHPGSGSCGRDPGHAPAMRLTMFSIILRVADAPGGKTQKI
jgi:hypothetical protein